jgi:hypothetical protein
MRRRAARARGLAKLAAPTAIAVFTAFTAFTGAGCHESGTWIDDAGNWQRALHCEVPAGIEVVRSWVWRSPHWTTEYEWYFELSNDAGLAPAEIVGAGLRQPTAAELDAELGWLSSPPEWFAPLEPAAYDAWVASEPGHGHLLLLVERGSARVFAGNCLL